MPDKDAKGQVVAAPKTAATPATASAASERSSTPHRSRNRRRRKTDVPGQARPDPSRPDHARSETRNKGEVAPPVTAPPSRGRNKRPLAEPRIGVGCIVMRGDQVLLVRERGRWSLPKGGLEVGELIQDGARRETYEETGLIVEARDLAFMVEFQAETWGHHLQFFYVGREVGGTLGPRDPDRDVQEAKFVSVRHLREYLRFRPRLVALEAWLRDRRPKHFTFNLNSEPAMLKKRMRVNAARSTPRSPEAKLERLTFEAEDELP